MYSATTLESPKKEISYPLPKLATHYSCFDYTNSNTFRRKGGSTLQPMIPNGLDSGERNLSQPDEWKSTCIEKQLKRRFFKANKLWEARKRLEREKRFMSTVSTLREASQTKEKPITL